MVSTWGNNRGESEFLTLIGSQSPIAMYMPFAILWILNLSYEIAKFVLQITFAQKRRIEPYVPPVPAV